ncbi:MAG: hypothetical protein HYW28_03435 [Rhodospirillales bacterium]|nr:hypothetical protein [Rhodospirillales bacterium]
MRQYLAFLRLRFHKANGSFRPFFRNHVVGMVVALLGSSAVLPLVSYTAADVTQEAALMFLYSVVGPVLVLLVVYVIVFAKSGSDLYFEKERETNSLTEQLNTIAGRRFSFALSSEPFSRVAFGGTSESPYTGSRQTQMLGDESVLRLTCRNDSGLRIEACRAFIVDVKEIDEGGNEVDLPFYENIPLLWSRDIKSDETTTDIEPWSAKLIYLFASRPAGVVLFRDVSGLPVEYRHLFFKQIRFRVWIQVNGSHDTGAKVCIDVEKHEGEKSGWTAKIVAQEAA